MIYDPKIFDEATMNNMRSAYMTLMELSKRQGPVLLNELPTMPRHLAISTGEDPNTFIPVHQMFHIQAINNPDRIALSCAEKNLAMSYGELDDASALRAHGTSSERHDGRMKRLTNYVKFSNSTVSPQSRLSFCICNGVSIFSSGYSQL